MGLSGGGGCLASLPGCRAKAVGRPALALGAPEARTPTAPTLGTAPQAWLSLRTLSCPGHTDGPGAHAALGGEDMVMADRWGGFLEKVASQPVAS